MLDLFADMTALLVGLAVLGIVAILRSRWQ
jgi:hypothetical protein